MRKRYRLSILNLQGYKDLNKIFCNYFTVEKKNT